MVNILHLEDNVADAEVIRRTLAKARISCRLKRVHTRQALDAALRSEQFDMILAEYRLTHYSGMRALRRVREAGIDVPFIFVSHVAGEDAFVEAMKLGASNYILKKRLARLAPAVKAALKSMAARHRDRKRHHDDTLISFALNNVHEAAFLVDETSRIRFVNDEACRSLGYPREELLKLTVPDIDTEFSVEQWNVYWRALKANQSLTFESRQKRKDGSVFPIEVNVSFLAYRGKEYNLALARDITRRKHTEEALWESSQMLKLVLDNMPAFVFWKDINSVYLGCNYRFAENAGLKSDKQIIGLTDYDLPWKDVEAESYRVDDRTVMESGVAKLNYEETQFTADGRLTAVRTSKIPLRNPEGMVIGVLGTFEDITERIRTEQKLAEAEAKYRGLVEESLVGVYVIQDRRLAFVNACAAQIFGYTQEEIIGRPIDDVIAPEDRDLVLENIRRRAEGEVERVQYIFRGIRKDGQRLDVEVLGARSIYGGRPAVQGTLINITERKRAELALRASLKEKETLLKEIHHRVKNNLQVISSLLSLQANETADPKVRTAFAESQDRIRSMALVHEQLYRSQLLSEIDFQQYINVVTSRLIEQHARRHITSSVQVDNVWLDIGLAIPCGLIVNELVSNCLKHAFVDREEGHITVCMRADPERNITLEVMDDGCGFPEGVDFLAVNSMGLTIVRTLVDQLDGSIRTVEGKGTHFVIEFSASRR